MLCCVFCLFTTLRGNKSPFYSLKYLLYTFQRSHQKHILGFPTVKHRVKQLSSAGLVCWLSSVSGYGCLKGPLGAAAVMEASQGLSVSNRSDAEQRWLLECVSHTFLPSGESWLSRWFTWGWQDSSHHCWSHKKRRTRQVFFCLTEITVHPFCCFTRRQAPPRTGSTSVCTSGTTIL